MAPQSKSESKQNGAIAPRKKDQPSMLEFYKGRTVLVTGVTGFIGKVLMEKTLRSLPDCHLLLLIRSKWGKSAQERVNAFTQTPLFERVKKECPNALAERVTVIESDLTQPGLGLSSEDRKKILAETSLVIHLAALVRLEAPLRPAILHNVQALRHLLDFCLEMPKLDCFVHTSTAFCHPEVENLEERLYSNDIFPKDVEDMLSWMNDDLVAENLPKLLKQHPNCYTFTKRLSEHLVGEYVGRLPLVILRPSIVTPSLREPMPGWVDSLNGPVGIVVGAGKGVIRSLLCNKTNLAEVVPVDVAANSILISIWHKVLYSQTKMQLQVYNISQHDIVQISWGEVLDKGRKLLYEYPFDGMVWYPDGDMRDSRLAHNTLVFCFQTVPAYILDGILSLVGQKTFLVRLQKRVLFGLDLLEYFANRQWSFENHNGIATSRTLSPADSKIFPTADVEFDVDDYLKDALLGARQYCMKEPLSTLPKARRQLKVNEKSRLRLNEQPSSMTAYANDRSSSRLRGFSDPPLDLLSRSETVPLAEHTIIKISRLLVVHRLSVIAFYLFVVWMFYRLFQAVAGRPVAWEV